MKTRLRLRVTPHKHWVCVETSSPVFTFHEYKQGQANFGVRLFFSHFVVGWLLFCIVVLFCFHTLLHHLVVTPFFHLVVLLCFFCFVTSFCCHILLLRFVASHYYCTLMFPLIPLFCHFIFVALFCCFLQFVTSSCFITLLHRFVILPCCFLIFILFKKKFLLFMKFFSFVYMFCLFSINVLVYVVHCAGIFGY